jgi:hypothetical protein
MSWAKLQRTKTLQITVLHWSTLIHYVFLLTIRLAPGLGIFPVKIFRNEVNELLLTSASTIRRIIHQRF